MLHSMNENGPPASWRAGTVDAHCCQSSIGHDVRVAGPPVEEPQQQAHRTWTGCGISIFGQSSPLLTSMSTKGGGCQAPHHTGSTGTRDLIPDRASMASPAARHRSSLNLGARIWTPVGRLSTTPVGTASPGTR